MELTGHRRRPVAGFIHRPTLSPQTQAATGRGPSSRDRTLCSPASSDGARQSPAQRPSSGQSGGLPSPSTSASPGDAPTLLRQHSAPAGSQSRSAVTRIARSNSGTAPSGPFKRPVKQRLSPFGRGPQAAPSREGEFRTAQVAPPREGEVGGSQVAPPREGEVGRGARSAHSPAGGGTTSTHAQLKQIVSERKLAYSSTNMRPSEKRDGKPVSAPYSTEIPGRHHYSSGVYSELAKVREKTAKMKVAAQTKSGYAMDKRTERSYCDANNMHLRKEQTDLLDNFPRNMVGGDAQNGQGILQSSKQKSRVFGNTDEILPPMGQSLQQRGDENKNYLDAKRTARREGQKMNPLMTHSEVDRSSLRHPEKRSHGSIPEERILKKPRHSELSWNSPDQSLSCQSTTASEGFRETNQTKSMNTWSGNKSSHVAQRSPYFVSQSSDHRRREEMTFSRRMGTMPPTHRMPHSTRGQNDRFRAHTSQLTGERTNRRPPLLPTPPSRFYSGGSPAVTTTTISLGETPPPVPHTSAVAPLGHHWATGMPLLPQFLEPLSPMSPLSVVSPPSPVLPLSPESLPLPSGPPSPSSYQPSNSVRDLSPRPKSPQEPTPYPLDRSRPAADRRRLISYTDRLSDCDCDSDSADYRVTCRSRPSFPNYLTTGSRPRSRDTDRGRFDSTHADAQRINIGRNSASRPGRSAVRSTGESSIRSTRTPTPTAASPPDRCRAERRPPVERQRRAPSARSNRSEQEHAWDGRCQDECCADECLDRASDCAAPLSAAAVRCPAPLSSRHRGNPRHAESARPRSRPRDDRRDRGEQPGGSEKPCEQPTTGGSLHDPPTTCCCEDHAEGDGADGGSQSGDLTSAGGQTSPGARDLSIFTSEYLSELLQLQRRIMTSRDSAEMARVLALLWETGQVQDTALYYDFDLCALDQGVVRQLQKCLS